MNANEIADELTKMFKGEEYDRLVHEIPDMLRQQQTEIERLTMLCDCMTTESNRKGNEIEALKVKAHEWYLIAMGKAQEK